MPTVFISHSSNDGAFVEEELLPFLESHGVAAWYSRDAIRTADEWDDRIREGLHSCEWFLVVMSSHAVRSDWVRAEVRWAMENRRGRVIPLLLDSCNPEDLHLKLPGIQHIDFRGDRDLARQQLLNVWTGDLRANRSRPRLPRKLAAIAAAVLTALIAAMLIVDRSQRSLRNPPAQAGEKAGGLRIQLRHDLVHEKSFSIVSNGSGQFVVERLFIQLHGYADCHRRDEVSVAAAASIPTAYAVHISRQYSQYDLPLLAAPGEAGVWKYVGKGSDEFTVRLSYDPYILYMISIDAEVKNLQDGRSFRISSDRFNLLDVAHGNAGGCLTLESWYTPPQLVAPGNAKYIDEGASMLARQLLTADLSGSSTYLTRISSKELNQVLPELVQIGRSHPENRVFARNIQIVSAFLRGFPWELGIRSAKAERDVIDAIQSQPGRQVLLRPDRRGRIFAVVRFGLLNLSSAPEYYDLRDFRLIDSRGHEYKSLGIVLALSPPSVAPGRFFDEPFRVDPGQAATEASETSLVFDVDESEHKLALKYRDLDAVDFVVER